jgi:hypothetical protein
MTWKEAGQNFLTGMAACIVVIPVLPLVIFIHSNYPEIELPLLFGSLAMSIILFWAWYKAKRRYVRWVCALSSFLCLGLAVGTAAFHGWMFQTQIVYAVCAIAFAGAFFVFARRVNRKLVRAIDTAGAELDGETFFYDGETISIELDRINVLAHVFAIALVVIGVVLLLRLTSVSSDVRVAGVLAGLFLGLIVLLLLRRLLSHAPAILITHDGIVDNATFYGMGMGLIPWQDIVGTTCTGPKSRDRTFSRRLLIIWVRHAAALKQRQPLLKRLLLPLMWGGAPSPVRIPEYMLSKRLEDVQAEILRYREAHTAHKHVSHEAREETEG